MEEGVVSEEEGERVAAIRQAYQADKDKLTKIKALLVREGGREGEGREGWREAEVEVMAELMRLSLSRYDCCLNNHLIDKSC